MKNIENNRLKNTKFNKNRGAADIYILAIMFILLIIIIVFSSFRTIMLSEVIYTIDDAVVDSALGAITPNNTDETPNIGQIIVNTPDNTGDTVAKNVEYTDQEKEIIASEMTTDVSKYTTEADKEKWSKYNISSHPFTGPEVTYKKEIGCSLKYPSTDEYYHYSQSKIDSRNLKPTDTQMHTLLNRLGSLINNNLSNSTNIKQPEIIDAFDTKEVENTLKIKNSDLKVNSFVGDYLASDIDITRLEAYSVYKYTLARRHIYASPWFKYEVKVDGVWKGPYTWDGENILDSKEIADSKSSRTTIKLSRKKEDGTDIKTEAIRDMVNATDKNCNGIEIKVSGLITDPNPNAPALNKMKEFESRDRTAYNMRSIMPLIFFENTGITCQTSWYDYTVEGKHYTNELNKEYGFLWNNDPHSAILIDKNSLTEVNDNTPYKDKTKVYNKPADYIIGQGKIPVIPIEGYTSYIYVKGNSGAIKRKYNSFASRTPDVDSDSDSKDSRISRKGITNKDVRITFGDYDNNGTPDDETSVTGYEKPFGYKDDTKRPKIFNTSLYVEAKYTVKTFITGDMFNIGPYSTKDVRVSKLVSLTKGENPE